ncbi:hypothetical protein NMY22_g11973 [Coprinellus aureogranulatus]|nr:hypothetical protein NMY22_g11973 [Coprinellus aureogranulatus]
MKVSAAVPQSLRSEKGSFLRSEAGSHFGSERCLNSTTYREPHLTLTTPTQLLFSFWFLRLPLCVFRKPEKLLLPQMLASELKEQHSARMRNMDLDVFAHRSQTRSPASLVNGDAISVISLPVVKVNTEWTLRKQSCFSACPLSDCDGAWMRRPPSCCRSHGPWASTSMDGVDAASLRMTTVGGSSLKGGSSRVHGGIRVQILSARAGGEDYLSYTPFPRSFSTPSKQRTTSDTACPVFLLHSPPHPVPIGVLHATPPSLACLPGRTSIERRELISSSTASVPTVSILFSTTTATELTRGGSPELETKISRGAAHDSAERGPYAPKCDEGTREAVQDDMLSWIDRGIEKLLWLTGPAGTGKSAIAGSIADKCNEDSRKWLAGSFFFSDFAKHPDRCSKEYLFSTLAYHLIHLNIPGLREEILSAIDACPSVFDKRLDDQLRILIVEPLRKVDEAAVQSSTFKVVVVDGVDECKEDREAEYATEQDRLRSKEDNHRQIISSIVRASTDSSFPFRIIIVSRPERAIEQCFSSLSPGAFTRIFLDDKYNPTADIKLYLCVKFDTIGHVFGLPERWYLNALPSDYPPEMQNVPRYLAQEASGQFVYAATVIRYIQDGMNTPPEQLRRLLNWRKYDVSKPLAPLDALYTRILRGSPNAALSVMWILALTGSGSSALFRSYSPWYQKAILESSPGQEEVVLGRLTALVGLSNEHGQPMFTFYHKSLADFLEDKDRSGNLHLEQKEVVEFLNDRYYQVLKNRGPQGIVPPDLQEFHRVFCSGLWHWVDHNRQYNASDVDWWIAPLLDPSRAGTLRSISEVFRRVHDECRWSHCLPACRVWRKGILRYLKGIGYPVPTPLDLFLAKFPRWWHLREIRRDEETIKSFCAARGIEVPSYL